MKSIKELKRGDYFVHRDEPFRVINKENVTFSTHSHTKVRVEAEGLFTNSKGVITM